MTITSRGPVAQTADQAKGTRERTTGQADAGRNDGARRHRSARCRRHARRRSRARLGEDRRRPLGDAAARCDRRHHWRRRTTGSSRPARPRASEAGVDRGGRGAVRRRRDLRTHGARVPRRVRDIAKDGKPSFPGSVRQAPDGRLRVQVFPANAFDRIVLPTTAEVWMQPASLEALVPGQAAAYSDPVAHRVGPRARGGQRRIARTRDVLSKLFVEGKVVVMKANPVNDYLVPHWTRPWRRSIEAGVLRIVDGDAAAGRTWPRTRASTRSTSPARTRPTTPSCSARATRARDGRRRRARCSTSPSPPSSATSHRSSSCPASGRPRPALPGGARRDDVGEQRGLQLPYPSGPGHRRLAAARRVPRRADPDARRHPHSPRLLPWRREPAATPSSPRIPSRPRQRPGRRAALDDHPRPRPGARTTSRSTSSRSSGSWPRLSADTGRGGFLDAATEFCNDVVWGTLGATIIVARRPSRTRGSPMRSSARWPTCATAPSG